MKSTNLSGVVKLSRRERWRMILQEARDGSLLVARNGEDVAESSATEDDLLASTFRIVNGVAWVNLRSTNGGDEGTCDREPGVKALAVTGRLTYDDPENN